MKKVRKRDRRWRDDLKAFEIKSTIFKFIPMYTYSKWIHGIGEVKWTKLFTPTDAKNAEYFK